MGLVGEDRPGVLEQAQAREVARERRIDTGAGADHVDVVQGQGLEERADVLCVKSAQFVGDPHQPHRGGAPDHLHEAHEEHGRDEGGIAVGRHRPELLLIADDGTLAVLVEAEFEAYLLIQVHLHPTIGAKDVLVLTHQGDILIRGQLHADTGVRAPCERNHGALVPHLAQHREERLLAHARCDPNAQILEALEVLSCGQRPAQLGIESRHQAVEGVQTAHEHTGVFEEAVHLVGELLDETPAFSALEPVAQLLRFEP